MQNGKIEKFAHFGNVGLWKGQTNYQHKEVFISQPFGAVASLFCIILW